MGGDGETILKHKVKAKEKDHLTNKKPSLDTMSQYRIPSFGFETKQIIDKPLKYQALIALSLHKNWAE